MTEEDRKKRWRIYFENQKRIWYDPKVPLHVKAIVRVVELHRSDSKGWSISVFRFMSLLGLSKNTILRAINQAISMKMIEADTNVQRKRRKLKLSGSLRAPVETENNTLGNLSQKINQSGSSIDTDSGIPNEPVNLNSNSKANSQ